ncbi:hypothetical protein DFJ77DRAFT_270919 [Powellomyces hirtus]|nr:hypothetical protein DFJ77DRAFT_270919 [Powellomyces hirtus]
MPQITGELRNLWRQRDSSVSDPSPLPPPDTSPLTLPTLPKAKSVALGISVCVQDHDAAAGDTNTLTVVDKVAQQQQEEEEERWRARSAGDCGGSWEPLFFPSSPPPPTHRLNTPIKVTRIGLPTTPTPTKDLLAYFYMPPAHPHSRSRSNSNPAGNHSQYRYGYEAPPKRAPTTPPSSVPRKPPARGRSWSAQPTHAPRPPARLPRMQSFTDSVV